MKSQMLEITRTVLIQMNPPRKGNYMGIIYMTTPKGTRSLGNL